MNIDWLKPLDQAVSKATGIPAQQLRAAWMNADVFTRRSVLLDDLCDRVGMHLALSRRMIERLEGLRFDPSAALDGASWHLPYPVMRLGTEQGSGVPPCAVWFAPKRDFDRGYSGVGMHVDMPNVPDDEPLLLVVIASTDGADAAIPGAFSAFHTLPEVVDGLNGVWKLGTDIAMSHPDHDETAVMQRVMRLVVSLGVYLSLDDAEPEPAPRRARWAPKVVRTSKAGSHLRLAMLDCPAPTGSRSAHMVREHLRNLRAERYYQGKWQSWPRGSRYALVRAHLRGTDEGEWPRADPAELERFDPDSKVCVMNCGPHKDDPRSAAERKFLCDDCEPAKPASVVK